MTRDDTILVWGVSIGEGLIAFMVTWLLAARGSAYVWEQPRAATIAMTLALVVGLTWATVRGLSRSRRRSR